MLDAWPLVIYIYTWIQSLHRTRLDESYTNTNCLTPSLNLSRVEKVKIAPTCLEQWQRQWLGKDVSKLISRGDELDVKELPSYTFPHKMIVNFNVFCPGMKDWI